MGQLANANLLDDSVANSSSLKNERLNKTALKAINPKPRINNDERAEEFKQQQQQQFRKEQVKEVDIEEEEIDDDFDDDYEEPNPPRFSKTSFANTNVKINNQEETEKENKILGMKPAVFCLLVVGAAIGGYFLYKKFFNKKNVNAAQLPTPTPTPVATPSATNIVG